MKHFSKLILCFLFGCFLSACSATEPSPEVVLTEPDVLPVISIETKSTGKDVMDFVTKPVT